MIEIVCCKDHPIMYKHQLAFVCSHTEPRTLKWPDGTYVLRGGCTIKFNRLTPDGEIMTDRFGWLRNYR
jgi:hypothetical protein